MKMYFPDQNLDSPQIKATVSIKTDLPLIPFFQRLQKWKLKEQFAMFLDLFRSFMSIEAISQIQAIQFFEKILSKKRKFTEFKTIKLYEEYSTMI